MSTIYRTTFFLSVILSFITACATQQDSEIASNSDNLDGRSGNIELDVLSAQGVSEGWIKYKVVLKNHGTQSLSDLKAVIIDDTGESHYAAITASQLEELPSGMNAALAGTGVSAATMSLAMLGIPIVGPLIMVGSSAGSLYASGEAARMSKIMSSFPQFSVTGKTLYVNDELVGSLFFPAAAPASVKLGYIRSGKREWAHIRSNQYEDTLASARPTYKNIDPAAKEIQSLLNQLGYPCGTADGIMGPKTREAIKRYQTDAGLPTDGKVSQELLAKLKTEL